jgi:hypothetical protein
MNSGDETLPHTQSSLRFLLDQPLTELVFFLYGIYICTEYINIDSVYRKLMCPIQFQSLLIFLDPPNGVFYSEVIKQSGDKASPCFRPFAYCATYLLTYLLHDAGYYLKSRLSLSLSKNIPLSYRTRRFITVFTKSRHRTLS